jgi:hypothetical protein
VMIVDASPRQDRGDDGKEGYLSRKSLVLGNSQVELKYSLESFE